MPKSVSHSSGSTLNHLSQELLSPSTPPGGVGIIPPRTGETLVMSTTTSSSGTRNSEEMKTTQLGEGTRIMQLGDQSARLQEEKVSSSTEWITKDTENLRTMLEVI